MDKLPDGITREELFDDILRYRACLKIERRRHLIAECILGAGYAGLIILYLL